jgi:phasin family protein
MSTKTKANAANHSAQAASEALDSVVTASKETVEQVVKAGADAAAKGYEKAAAMNKENLDAAARSYDEFAAFGKENVDAVMAAGNAATKGFEAISGEVMALTRGTFEDGVAAGKAVMGARTYHEAMELQSNFAQASMQRFLDTTTRLGEMSIKLTNDAFEPVNARVNAAVEKLSKPVTF